MKNIRKQTIIDNSRPLAVQSFKAKRLTKQSKPAWWNKNDLMAIVAENKQAFIGHNISRLRELIRYLPPSRLALFQTIPFLLHVNSPGYIGFIDTNTPAHGIARFQFSGFYNYAQKKFNLSKENIIAITSDPPIILGLYLMGSAGTLTQTDKSDFDYWVVINKDKLSENQLKNLSSKIKSIEKWCQQSYQQEVNFFIMDKRQIKENDFSTIDSESSGSAQKTILKDEFYRTFIMIAGQIPIWAVLPVNTDNNNYDQATALMIQSTCDETDNDYLDTGNLTCMDPSEALGAILWQVYKARKDPVKSLIKSSLIAYYFFCDSQAEPILCNIVKKNFANALIDDYSYDPYHLVFEKIVKFYNDIDDLPGEKLIKQCIILRLLSFPDIAVPDAENPKGKVLDKLIRRWKLSRKDMNIIASYTHWSESEKIQHDEKIFDRLSFIYELILRSDKGPDVNKNMGLYMKKKDLEILRNRTAAFIQKKQNKLIKCSSYLRNRKHTISLAIHNTPDAENEKHWKVFDNGSQNSLVPLVFEGHTLLQAIGWVLFNNLYGPNHTPLTIAYNKDTWFLSDPKKVLSETMHFFQDLFTEDDNAYQKAPLVKKMAVMLDATTEKIDIFDQADFLYANAWGEFFFTKIDLSGIESHEMKCYTISELIVQSFGSSDPFSHENYFICTHKASKEPDVKRMVKRAIEDLMTRQGKPENKEQPDHKPEKKSRLYLDLL